MLTQLSLPFGAPRRPTRREPARDVLVVGHRRFQVTYVRHRRARHYVLHVEDDGSVRVTIPRGGSRTDAWRFAKEKADWVERERYRRALSRAGAEGWQDGSLVLVGGEQRRLTVDREARVIRIGDEAIPFADDPARTARELVTTWLRGLAARELPARLLELAAPLGFAVAGVTVRDQRSRWGSCSHSGRISLNWRLVQVPPAVRDYVLLHELTHLVERNHSPRFWKRLESVCPGSREARVWLRTRFSGTMSDPWSQNTPTGSASPDASAPPS